MLSQLINKLLDMKGFNPPIKVTGIKEWSEL
jgi:hypothetical protein